MYIVPGATIEKKLKKKHRLHRVLKTGSSGNSVISKKLFLYIWSPIFEVGVLNYHY